MEKEIFVKGARTHNLKNIDVAIPRGKMTALIGVSGAGKTSLAFDTLYAEGYLRYIESISPYIRQFLDQMDRPPVDKITGLPPTIAVRHKTPAKNTRAIVATALDVYDYLQLLYARIAQCTCPGCGRPIKAYSIDQIIPELIEQYHEKIDFCFSYQGDIAFLVNRGYYFYMDAQSGEKSRVQHPEKDRLIDVIIDSVEPLPENRGRMFEALDKSMAMGKGNAIIYYVDPITRLKKKRVFSPDLSCSYCSTRLPLPDEFLFSFNSPKGACGHCKGLGHIQSLNPQAIFQTGLSLADGALRPFRSPATRNYGQEMLLFAQQQGMDLQCPVESLSQAQRNLLLEGNGTFAGIQGFFARLKTRGYKVQARVFVSRYSAFFPCPVCGGTRLNEQARAFTINGKNIAEFLRFTVQEAADFIGNLDYQNFKDRISPEVLADITSRLDFLVRTGLPYLRLDRPVHTLSRGEYQRINLAFILGSTLSDSLLILDQPSSDLHPRDYEKLNAFLWRLVENHNTLLIIEHNPALVRACHHVVELGPLAGEKGGSIVYQGAVRDFFNPLLPGESLSRDCFSRPLPLLKNPDPLQRWLSFPAASSHNLKGFLCRIPLHALTAVVGVSGAGKTTLLFHEFYRITRKKLSHSGRSGPVREVVFIAPGRQQIGVNTNVAGFFALFTPLREMFAALKESRVLGYTPGSFSFFSPQGRCEECRGRGYKSIEMQFLPPVKLGCNTCNGSGYRTDILKIRLRDKNIWEWLALTVEQFIQEIGQEWSPAQKELLNTLQENGLGYIRLGQPLKTLSSGEFQRLKLVKYLHARTQHTLFLLDEPTFGLHPHDVQKVIGLLDRLLAQLNTVVVAGHHPDIITHADYILELGPGGGENGGHLIYQGSCHEMINHPHSITGNYLKNIAKST